MTAVLAQIGRTLAKNPLVIGILAGSAVRVAGLPVTGVVATTLDQVAATAGPTALLSIGMAVHRYGIRGNLGLAAVAAALKLVLLLPAVVLAAGTALGLDPTWTAAMVLTAAVPTGVNAYLIANHFGVGTASPRHDHADDARGGRDVTLWAYFLGL